MKSINIIIRVIDIVFSIVLAILGLRLILKLFAANPGTPFVAWIYDMSQPLLTPFAGIFPAPQLQQGIILEFTTIFAIMM